MFADGPSITNPPRLAAGALAWEEQLVSALSSSSSREWFRAESNEPALALRRLQLSSGERDLNDIRSSPMLPLLVSVLPLPPPPNWKMVESVELQSDEVVSWKE